MTTIEEGSEILVQTNDLTWESLGEGVGIKVLRVSEETGQWTALIRMEAGATFAAHKHFGAADGYITKGKLEYRIGSASAGSYLYEPLGAVHDATTCSSETEILFTSYGPIVFYNEDGSIAQLLSYETALALLSGSKEHFTANKAKPAA